MIDRVFAFEQAPEAFRYHERDRPYGKVVIGLSDRSRSATV
ncbi:zinc-binding dehydrogenase [Actinoplanes derwentensis]